jgi:pSer/pThr/pTyr-binding forkhead associated (FHA) protein
MKVSLLVLTSGKQEGKLLPLNLAQFVIGRDPQCQLRPASPLISKRHCAILQRDGKAFLRDFDSTNGTFVNGQKVVGEVELKQDDRVKVGPIEFCIRLEGTPADRRTPAPASRTPAKAAAAEAAQDAPAPPADKDTAKMAALDDTSTLKPTAKPRAADDEKSGASDEDVAAMLLSLQDDDSSGGGVPSAEQRVPDGSTEMDLRVPEGALDEKKDAPQNAKGGKKPEGKPKGDGNTVSAAKSILEKMMRRPR